MKRTKHNKKKQPYKYKTVKEFIRVHRAYEEGMISAWKHVKCRCIALPYKVESPLLRQQLQVYGRVKLAA